MLRINDTVLVLVDIQEKLSALVCDRENLLQQLSILVDGAKHLHIPIIWMEQIPEKMGGTVSQIRERVTTGEPTAKVSFSCCGNDDFIRQLRETGRHQVLLAGIETHVCVYQTAMHLLELGYEVEVVADAVSSRTTRNHQLALDRLARAGTGVTSVEMLLFELMETSTHPAFREILRLVK